MNNAIYNFREPDNEPVLSYLSGSNERKLLEKELEEQGSKVVDIPLIIGGKEIRTGQTGKIVMPTDHNISQSDGKGGGACNKGRT
jgi:1-pyrroline-5-carboxylate dehydrogenase